VGTITPGRSWVWRGSISAALIVCSFAFATRAAEVLFPRPMHIVRSIEDPLAGKTITLHEYCAGDRIITVHGSRVLIADYGQQRLTEIDRAAGTYSVTKFEELARAVLPRKPQRGTWKVTPVGVKGAQSGRSLDSFELTRDGGENITMQLGVDRATPLSRAAVEVLIGAAYPHQRRDEHEAVLRAIGGARRERGIVVNAVAETEYALPYEQTTTIEVDGERLTTRNRVVDLRFELAPEDVTLIPPGARLVESRAVRLARELRELDQLPNQKSEPR
jgi:hypothetical protein